MDNGPEFRQLKQPHKNIAGEWLSDTNGEVLLDLLPEGLGLLVFAVCIIFDIFWFVWSIGREIFGGPS